MALDKKGRDDLREKALNAELIGTEWVQKLVCAVRELLDELDDLVPLEEITQYGYKNRDGGYIYGQDMEKVAEQAGSRDVLRRTLTRTDPRKSIVIGHGPWESIPAPRPPNKLGAATHYAVQKGDLIRDAYLGEDGKLWLWLFDAVHGTSVWRLASNPRTYTLFSRATYVRATTHNNTTVLVRRAGLENELKKGS